MALRPSQAIELQIIPPTSPVDRTAHAQLSAHSGMAVTRIC